MKGRDFMGINKFFMDINDLERLIRCPGRHKLMEHNVSAHTFKVSQYALFFAELEERAGRKIDWKKLYEKTNCHDVSEIWLTDIPTPVKHFNVQINKMIEEIEEHLVFSYINTEVPEEFRDLFIRRLTAHKDNTIEGQILTLCDKLDQLYEALQEIVLGNHVLEFRNMFYNAFKTVESLEDVLPVSVNYFLKEIMPDIMDLLQKHDEEVYEKTSELLASYKSRARFRLELEAAFS